MRVRQLLGKLAWGDVTKELEQQKDKCTTGRGRVAFKGELKKVEYMEFMQNVLARNLKGHVFRGKLNRATVLEVNQDRLIITRKVGELNSKQTITWQKFYKDYPGNLNELINAYVVNGRTKGILDIGDWRKAMIGAALTIRMICAEVNGAMERSTYLVKEVAKQRYSSELKSMFPDVQFNGE